MIRIGNGNVLERPGELFTRFENPHVAVREVCPVYT